MQLILRSDDEHWHYGSVGHTHERSTPLSMISHIAARGGACHDLTVTVRMSELSAAIEHYPHIAQYWHKRLSGEMDT